jgi:hypothetical protein
LSKSAESEEDGLVEGFHGIPSRSTLESMSILQLADLLAICEPGSAKFLVIDREWRRRLAQDQAAALSEKRSLWSHPAVRTALSVVGTVAAAALVYYYGLR